MARRRGDAILKTAGFWIILAVACWGCRSGHFEKDANQASPSAESKPVTAPKRLTARVLEIPITKETQRQALSIDVNAWIYVELADETSGEFFSNAEFDWSLKVDEKESSGSLKTDARGFAKIPLSTSLRPYQNEKDSLLTLKLTSKNDSSLVSQTTLLLITDGASGLEIPFLEPTPEDLTGKNAIRTIQPLMIEEPRIQEIQIHSKTTVTQSLRLESVGSYEMTWKPYVTRLTRRHEREALPLRNVKLTGKILIVHPETNEILFEFIGDAFAANDVGTTAIRLQIPWSDFRSKNLAFDVIAALEAPDMSQTPPAYFRFNKVSLAAEILDFGSLPQNIQSALIDLHKNSGATSQKNTPSPAPIASLFPRAATPIDLKDVKTGTALASLLERTLQDPSTSAFAQDKAEKFYRAFSGLRSMSVFSPEVLRNLSKYFEIHEKDRILAFTAAPELIDVKTTFYEAAGPQLLPLKIEELKYRVFARAERCLVFYFKPENNIFYYCSGEISIERDIQWFHITSAQNDTGLEFLHRDEVPSDFSLPTLRKNDLFRHPELAPAGIVFQKLFPAY